MTLIVEMMKLISSVRSLNIIDARNDRQVEAGRSDTRVKCRINNTSISTNLGKIFSRIRIGGNALRHEKSVLLCTCNIRRHCYSYRFKNNCTVFLTVFRIRVCEK